jgi:hypothetical protein
LINIITTITITPHHHNHPTTSSVITNVDLAALEYRGAVDAVNRACREQALPPELTVLTE